MRRYALAVRRALLFAIAMFLAGCGRPAPTGAEKVGLEFGQAVVRQDWEAVQAMTSSHWQKKWSRDGTRGLFKSLSHEIGIAAGKPFAPTEVTVKTRGLPKDPLDARERLGITTEPPMEGWIAFLEVQLRDPQSKAAVVAPLLVVREKGALRVAFLAFRQASG